MSPIQQMLLGVGAVATKTYVDDVFSTYLYEETGTTVTVNNGVDMSEGGMVWFKNREATDSHVLIDTVRGGTQVIHSDTNAAQSTQSGAITSFNNNGFAIGNYGAINGGSNKDVASWSFRRASGFFDVVTYTGNSTNRTISHSLESIPGMILIKELTDTSKWIVYHRSIGAANILSLNETDAAESAATNFNSTDPTSTHFSLGGSSHVNKTGDNYVAYLFAGGESTAATATSCNFLGTSASGDYDNNKIFCGHINGTKTADLVYGTGDFTWEAWVKCESSSNIYRRIFHHGQEWTNGTALGLNWDNNNNQNQFSLWSYNLSSGSAIVHSQTHNFDDDGQWHHVAVSRQSGTFRIFVDGILEGTNSSYSGSTENVSTNFLTIGATHNANVQECFKGNISNVRIVKGTAVYTSSFRPSYEPLANITNTVLLCCNGSSVTSATVTPITLTVGDSSVTASTDSPFDDPAGFVFGESGSESVIKTGSYVGNGSSDGPEIFLGFEPQYILIKRSSASESWMIFDAIRGMTTQAGNDMDLRADLTNSENDVRDYIDITPTGFKQVNTQLMMNGNGDTYIYMCIRRPDGYVGKPAEAGTDVFTMVTGVALANGNPNYISNGVRDFGIFRKPATTENWNNFSRLTQGTNILLNTTGAESSLSVHKADFNNGMVEATGSDIGSYQAWMWKRHAGFDVVTYTGDDVRGRHIPHSLNAVPEMMIIKTRSSSYGWCVYHKGLNGGTNPEQKFLLLNTTDAEAAAAAVRFNNTAPTSTHFIVGEDGEVNADGDNYIAMLFASVDGISKVGSFVGSDSDQTITLGFQPRFLIVKAYNQSYSWLVLDSTRGWATSSGNNSNYLFLESSAAQGSIDIGYTTSTGFVAKGNNGNINDAGASYVYYAHA